MTASSASQQIHLLVASSSAPEAKGARSAPFQAIEVPEGISYLVSDNGGPPRLSAKRPDSAGAVFIIEPVFVEHQAQAILISPPSQRARVNGQLAPRAKLIREKDAIHVDDEQVIHVTVFNRPRVGPTPPELVGKECPVCRTKFGVADVVYVCACQTAIHVKSAGEPPLECVKVTSECPSGDGRPIVLTEGYSWLPEE